MKILTIVINLYICYISGEIIQLPGGFESEIESGVEENGQKIGKVGVWRYYLINN